MNNEEEKKKFLKDQMKAMLGPCMITFAIPLTIPGLTLTLVVFSGDKTFPKYGALHIIGLLFLGASIILIILGCIFRFMWKPRMDPEVLQQLTPANSMRMRGRRDVEAGRRERTLNDVYKGDGKDRKSYSPRPTESNNKHETTRNNSNFHSNSTSLQNGLQHKEIPQSASVSLTLNRLPEQEVEALPKHNTKHVSETNFSEESNESDSHAVDSIKRKHGSNSTSVKSPRHSRHLAPLITTYVNEDNKQRPGSPRGKQPSYDDIQNWRRKKKKKSKQRSDTGFGVDNHGSDCDEIHSDNNSSSGKVIQPEAVSKHDDSSETGEDNLPRHTSRTAETSLLDSSDTKTIKEKKRKKKKKKYLKSSENATEQVSTESKSGKEVSSGGLSFVPEKRQLNVESENYARNERSLFQNDVDMNDSDGSIGSADSVLAQYTSRPHKDKSIETQQ